MKQIYLLINNDRERASKTARANVLLTSKVLSKNISSSLKQNYKPHQTSGLQWNDQFHDTLADYRLGREAGKWIELVRPLRSDRAAWRPSGDGQMPWSRGWAVPLHLLECLMLQHRQESSSRSVHCTVSTEWFLKAQTHKSKHCGFNWKLKFHTISKHCCHNCKFPDIILF